MRSIYRITLLLAVFVAMGDIADGSIPPHSRVRQMIAAGQIAEPYYLQHLDELRARGINAPWAASEVLARRVTDLSEATRSLGPAAVPMGSYNALVLMVDFSDNIQQVEAAFFDSLVFNNSPGTMRDYFQQVSYGNLDVVTVHLPSVTGWNRAPQTYAYYVNALNGMGTYPQNAQKLVEDVVVAVDGVVDFSQYDNDLDNFVDALFVVHAGPGAEFTGSDYDIWSHAWETYNPPVLDGVTIFHYSMEPEYWDIDEDDVFDPGEDMTVGVYAHEMGHAAFGLPDLYDRDYTSNGLGSWSVMASGSWNGNLGDSPALPDAWCHYQMGYVTPTNISVEVTGQAVANVETYPEVYRLWTNGVIGDQYFLVENRQQLGYDAALPGSGLLIYHVDQSVTSQNDNEWYPGYTDYGHYRVALEQADGLWDLEQNISSQGDGGDPYPGTTANLTFDSFSTPGSQDYSDNQTYVAVRNISGSASTMTADFEVNSPVIGVTPDSLHADLFAGDTTVKTITLSNVGGGSLAFSILAEQVSASAVSPTQPLTNDYTKPPSGFSDVLAQGSSAGSQISVWEANGINEATYNRLSSTSRGNFGWENEGFASSDKVQNSRSHTTTAASYWIIEDFETGTWPWSPWISADIGGGSTISACAHDGSYGITDGGYSYKLDWYYQTDVLLGDAGDQLSIWVKPDNSNEGRFYLGFGADASGCWSLIMAPNTGELIIQQNSGYSYYDVASVSQVWTADVWYRMEVTFDGGEQVTGRLYASDGTTLLNTISATLSGFQPAGIAIRCFDGFCGDTIEKPGIRWLALQPESGILAPGNSLDILVTFDATDLYGGDYAADIMVSSNDPVNPEVRIPATLHVTADVPDITVSSDTLDYGTVFIGLSDTLTLVVSNSGADLLTISSIVSTNPAYTKDLTAFGLSPGESQAVTVIFEPASVGDFPGTLSITSDDPDEPTVTVVLLGQGASPPVISVSQDSLSEDLFIGETSIQHLTISNDGNGDLNFSITHTEGNSIYSASSDKLPLYVNPIQFENISSTDQNSIEVEDMTESERAILCYPVETSNTQVEQDPSNKSLPIINGSLSLLVDSTLIIVDSFSAPSGGCRGLTWGNGYLWVSCASTSDYIYQIDPAGGTVISSFSAPGTFPIGLAWDDDSPGGPYLWNSDEETDIIYKIRVSDFQVIDSFTAPDIWPRDLAWDGSNLWCVGSNNNKIYQLDPVNGNVLFSFDTPIDWPAGLAWDSNSQGGPNLWHSNSDFSGDNDFIYILSPDDGNIVQTFDAPGTYPTGLAWDNVSQGWPFLWCVDWSTNLIYQLKVPGVDSLWLSYSPSSGTIPAGSSMDIEVAFNATGLNGGDYDADIVVAGNDPVTPEIRVPAHLSVTGTPDITVSNDTLDYGAVFIGGSDSLTLTVSNSGTDLLTVSSIVSTNSAYTIDLTTFSVSLSESQAVTVIFEPASVGNFPGILTITSDDPDEPAVAVVLLGQGASPPVIVVSPDSLSEDLFAGDSSVQYLTIDNSAGGSDLIFDMEIAAPAGVSSASLAEGEPVVHIDGTQYQGLSAELVRTLNEELLSSGMQGTITASTPQGDLPNVNWQWLYTDPNEGSWPYDIQHVYAAHSSDELLFKMDSYTPITGTEDVIIIIDADQNTSTGYPDIDWLLGTNYWIEYSPYLGLNVVGQLVYLGGDEYDWILLDSLSTAFAGSDGFELVLGMSRHHLGASSAINFAILVFDADGWDWWDSVPDIGMGNISYQFDESWLSLSDVSGLVPAGSSAQIGVVFRAENLSTGDYSTDIVISSNDPVNPVIRVPTTLQVWDEADIAISSDTLDYGVVFPEGTKTISLDISNPGSQVLTVSSISTNNNAYTVDTTSFVLSPSASQGVLVTFTPPDLGAFNASLTIVSDDPDESVLTIPLVGQCLEPPIMVITPDSLGVELSFLDTSVQILTIDNTAGGSELAFRISVDQIAVATAKINGSLANLKNSVRTRSVADVGQPVDAVPSWLKLSPESGVIPAGSSSDIEVKFDARSMAVGDYAAEIVITGTDPDNPIATRKAYLKVLFPEISPPQITAIEDVPEDGGGWVDVTWLASADDNDSSATPVTSYRVWLKDTTAAVASSPSVLAKAMSPEPEDGISSVAPEAATSATPLVHDQRSGSKAMIDELMVKQPHESPAQVTFDPLTTDNPAGLQDIITGMLYEVAASSEPVVDADTLEGWTVIDIIEATRDSLYSLQVPVPEDSNETGMNWVYVKIAAYTVYPEVYAFSEVDSGYSVNNAALAMAAGISDLPEAFALHQNYPNPFNPTTTVRFDVPAATNLSLVIYDILGREVIRLRDGYVEPGYHQVVWNGRTALGKEVPTGVYILRMVTGQPASGYTKHVKLVLLK
ncbi:MAG: M6 family metalloprotease domain-containing protein [Fidelibacterota bacterium]|nr:MAG: M6 family metalloprotease domain-containing protein [Candidatus Neomarinimicrobiota bacterium]